MAVSILVSQSSPTGNRRATTHQQQRADSPGHTIQASSGTKDEIVGSALFREQRHAGKLSQKAREIIRASWRSHTRAKYTSIANRWQNFLRARGLCQGTATVYHMSEFLACQFGKGNEYKTLCGISTVLNKFVSLSIKDRLLVGPVYEGGV